MPKRTNEQSQSEPAAKRVANSSSHEDLLVEAQASLDRLDFKTTEAICSQIIDLNPEGAYQPLMMRSISLGKTNRQYEAVQDVERALNSKKSVETHLRAAFAYLGMVKHHLDLAKGHFVENQEPTTSLPCLNVIELEDSIQEAKDLEKRGSFKRVSPELFVKIVSFCDSPSLMRCARVSKQFNQSILDDEELFRSFTMRGTSYQILQGLILFSGRCNYSLHSVKLEVLDEVDYNVKVKLETHLLGSTNTLRSMEVAHKGDDLGLALLSVAQCCPLLKVFSSSKLGSTDKFHIPTSNHLFYRVKPDIWRVKQLETFIVTCGSFNLQCDDNLLSVLQGTKVIKLSEDGVNQSWIIKLLSSTPSLVEVEIPLHVEIFDEVEDESIELPHFNLPSLTLLNLARTPLEASYQHESQFSEKLVAPSLQDLSLGEVRNLAHLKFLNSSPQIRRLTIGVSNLSIYPSGGMAASTLLRSIYGWDRLQDLNIKAKGTWSTQFRDSLVSFLTPHSRGNVLSEWKGILLLPQLTSLDFGGKEDVSGNVDLVDLACLVSSRRAVHEQLPLEVVLSRANGDFEAVQQASISSRNLLFKTGTPQICSPIQSIDLEELDGSSVDDPNTSKAVQWLHENLSHFKEPYLFFSGSFFAPSPWFKRP